MAIRNLITNMIVRNAAFNRRFRQSGRELQTFNTKMSATKKLAIGLGTALGAYVTIRGIIALGRSFVKAASDAEETQAKFDTVFKHLSSQANQWADEFGESVGRTNRDVKSWMATLQDTFVPLGFSRQKSLELAKSLTKLSVDVASFNNRMDADVIRDFTSALVGNHETVRKYGIMISEGSIALEAMASGLNKSYKELTDLEKVQLRYNIIQQSSTDAMGDAIRTADSFANQVKRLSANWADLSEELGKFIIPALTELVKQLNSVFNTINASFGERELINKIVVDDKAIAKVTRFTKEQIEAKQKEINALKQAEKLLEKFRNTSQAVRDELETLGMSKFEESVFRAQRMVTEIWEASDKNLDVWSDIMDVYEKIYFNLERIAAKEKEIEASKLRQQKLDQTRKDYEYIIYELMSDEEKMWGDYNKALTTLMEAFKNGWIKTMEEMDELESKLYDRIFGTGGYRPRGEEIDTRFQTLSNYSRSSNPVVNELQEIKKLSQTQKYYLKMLAEKTVTSFN